MDKKNKDPYAFALEAFPKKPNYEYVGEYFASKASLPQRSLLRLNNGDDIQRNVEIQNYFLRKTLDTTVKRLEWKRKNYEAKLILVKAQWEDLQHKEAALRRNVIKFNKFVKENQEKKERAAVKLIEQQQLAEEREERTAELINKCDDIYETKAMMDSLISEYRIYEDYLQKVVDLEETTSQSINDLLRRYETLLDAREELQKIQKRDMRRLEKAKTNLTDIIKNSENKVGSLRNKLGDLQGKFEEAQQKTQKLERIFKYAQLKTTGTVVNTVGIKESCRKMYMEICKRKKIGSTHLNNVEQQLMTIKKAIGDYEEINGKVQEIQANACKESVEAKGSYSTI